MPIITLQRRQTEVGRIRIGEQVTGSNGKPRPAKLDKFRITTASRRLIDEVARLYGGEVRKWTGSPSGVQWEVYTDASSMPVVVPPQNFLTQWYEMWSGGGCQRRCDGQTEQRIGQPCLCPADLYERGQLAAKGKACKATTRLNIMLAEVPSIGVWRLESHGNNAAIEMPGVAEVLAQAGGYVEGVLELQQRKQIVQKPGGGSETRQFIVPYLDVHQAPREVVALSAGPGASRAAVAGGTERQAIGSVPADVPAASGEQVDWSARIAGVVDEASWRALRAEMQHGGELTPGLDEALMARAREIKAEQRQQAQAGEVVDAEVVDEPAQPAAKPRDPRTAGAPADAMQVWQQVLLAAADRQWTATETQKRMKEAIGVGVADATGEQMAEFLHQIQNGRN
jgi:hypothetical protein